MTAGGAAARDAPPGKASTEARGLPEGHLREVRRIAALVEYDGTDFAGWQSQAHAVSVQDAVEAAVGFVAGHPVIVICAGRTDSGVHAAGQVIHFDTSAVRTPRAWQARSRFGQISVSIMMKSRGRTSRMVRRTMKVQSNGK